MKTYTDAEIENAANHCFERYFKNAAEIIMSDLLELHDCAAIDSRGEGVADLPFDTVELVVRALTQMGIATPDSKEHQSAVSNRLVKELCWSVRDHWAGLNATDPPRPADAGKDVDEAELWLLIKTVMQQALCISEKMPLPNPPDDTMAKAIVD